MYGQYRHSIDDPDHVAPAPTRPKPPSLAQALEVSVRTVQRYINMLDEMGIPMMVKDESISHHPLSLKAHSLT